jgi:hypothetical protein
MPRSLVAIHQPNFLPWLGYFDKIARADRFVLLDSVQFSKTGGTWSNRVRICVAGQPAWATVPVRRDYHGTRLVREMRIDETVPWRERLSRMLRANYARARHFGEVFPVVEKLLSNPTDNLSDLNVASIRSILEALGWDAGGLVLASGLDVHGRGTDLLISIVGAVGGSAYLCGGGAQGYQQDERFAEAGIELVYQAFQHPEYPQPGAAEFQPGLSIVDALMHVGFAGTARLLAG